MEFFISFILKILLSLPHIPYSLPCVRMQTIKASWFSSTFIEYFLIVFKISFALRFVCTLTRNPREDQHFSKFRTSICVPFRIPWGVFWVLMMIQFPALLDFLAKYLFCGFFPGISWIVVILLGLSMLSIFEALSIVSFNFLSKIFFKMKAPAIKKLKLQNRFWLN